MSTENLTKEQEFLNTQRIARSDVSMSGVKYTYSQTVNLLRAYATQQVEQQTKHLREERDRAVEILKQFVRGDLKDLLLPSENRVINEFLNQLNQKDEG